MAGHDIIVIGASLGGVETLSDLMRELPKELPAAIFVTLHLSPETKSTLDQILNRNSKLIAHMARDHDLIEFGHVYIAPADYHLLIKKGHMRITQGPRENHWRPAIDPMFRSAAVTYGSRVVGVILTGLLDDGAAGLLAVKQCGGVTMVQDPMDALFPDMPRNASESVEVDYVLPIAKIAVALDRLAREPAPKSPPIPEHILLEDRVVEELGMSDAIATERLGELAPFTCPECGGPLWEMDDKAIPRFRCHMGHAYTARTLLKDQQIATEGALLAAQRLFEERIKVLKKIAREERNRRRERSAKIYEEKAEEIKIHSMAIRKLLLNQVESN